MSYSNLNPNSFRYQKHVQTSFASFNDVNNVNEFWKWLSFDFINTLKSIDINNVQSVSNNNYFLSDSTSVLIGYPIVRQIRIKKYHTICVMVF